MGHQGRSSEDMLEWDERGDADTSATDRAERAPECPRIDPAARQTPAVAFLTSLAGRDGVLAFVGEVADSVLISSGVTVTTACSIVGERLNRRSSGRAAPEGRACRAVAPTQGGVEACEAGVPISGGSASVGAMSTGTGIHLQVILRLPPRASRGHVVPPGDGEEMHRENPLPRTCRRDSGWTVVQKRAATQKFAPRFPGCRRRGASSCSDEYPTGITLRRHPCHGRCSRRVRFSEWSIGAIASVPARDVVDRRTVRRIGTRD